MTKTTMRRPFGSKHGKIRSIVKDLQEIPNVGPSISADLRLIGIKSPAELAGLDPYQMYDDLVRTTGQRHDPCVIDVFISAVRFMEGAPNRPWWKYTAERKKTLLARLNTHD